MTTRPADVRDLGALIAQLIADLAAERDQHPAGSLRAENLEARIRVLKEERATITAREGSPSTTGEP
jgi:hypothetical protein